MLRPRRGSSCHVLRPRKLESIAIAIAIAIIVLLEAVVKIAMADPAWVRSALLQSLVAELSLLLLFLRILLRILLRIRRLPWPSFHPSLQPAPSQPICSFIPRYPDPQLLLLALLLLLLLHFRCCCCCFCRPRSIPL
jgi:hypothetical protein